MLLQSNDAETSFHAGIMCLVSSSQSLTPPLMLLHLKINESQTYRMDEPHEVFTTSMKFGNQGTFLFYTMSRTG